MSTIIRFRVRCGWRRSWQLLFIDGPREDEPMIEGIETETNRYAESTLQSKKLSLPQTDCWHGAHHHQEYDRVLERERPLLMVPPLTLWMGFYLPSSTAAEQYISTTTTRAPSLHLSKGALKAGLWRDWLIEDILQAPSTMSGDLRA